MSGIESAANAFSAQSIQYSWITGIPAVEARMKFLNAYEKSDRRDRGSTDEITQADVDILANHLHTEARLFKDGTPVFVTAEAMDLVDEAVEEMPSEVLLHQDLPMDEFILWFERPLPYHPEVVDFDGHRHKEEWSLDAIGVQYVEHGIVVYENGKNINKRLAYSDSQDVPDDKLTDGIVIYAYVSYKNIPPSMGEIDYKFFGPYGIIDFIGVGFDVDWSDREIDGPARNLHKWIIAMLRLMGEHIELRSTGVPRALRRSAVRSGRKIPQDGYLSVAHLRSVIYEGEEGETDEQRHLRWKHRVRGHWRRFYCASLGLEVGDPKAYRHRYVNAYIRGPSDAPLIESHKVVVVDR